MTSWIAGVTTWVSVHPTLAYGVIFLLALSESIPLIGVIVPGTAVIVAISALVPGGSLQLWPVIAAAFAGAVIGDGLPYWIGHRHHETILQRWPLVRYPQMIAKSGTFIDHHGSKSVFLARFTPGVRAFVPLFAGILRMPARRFYRANILSAAVWAPTHVLPGVLLGATFSHLGPAALPFAGLFIVLVLTIWVTIKTVRYAVLRATPLIVAGTKRLHGWAEQQTSKPVRSVARLLDPARAQTRSLLILGAALVGSAWVFLGIFEDVIGNDPLVRVDTALYQNLQALRTAPGDALMIAITEIGDAAVVVAIALSVMVWLLARRAWRTAIYWTVAIAGATLLNTVIKVALHRPRPGNPLYEGWSAYSFPSGHSTVNVVLYGFLALLVVQGISRRARLPVILGAALIALLIAFSRLYLGAHWASDVAGGVAFGCAWISLLGAYYLYGPRENIGAKGLLVVACLALVTAGATHVARQHHADSAAYAVKSDAPTLQASEWRTSAWTTFPARRTDLSGEIEEPLSIQWAGDLEPLRQTLMAKGWVPAPSWNLAGLAHWLGSKATAQELPVIPALNAGRLSGLTMIEQGNNPESTDTRRILRLWPADIDIVGQSTVPLWFGSIIEEKLYRPLSLFTLVWTPQHDGSSVNTLGNTLINPHLVTRIAVGAAQSRDIKVLLAGVQ
mgnify:CR=1 FL=1